MTEVNLIVEKRKRVRALVMFFLSQMGTRAKEETFAKSYYGQNTRDRTRLHKHILTALPDAHNQLNSEKFFSLSPDELSTIEKNLSDGLRQLNFDLGGIFNFNPREDVVIPGVRDYKQYDGKWARVPLRDDLETTERIKKAISIQELDFSSGFLNERSPRSKTTRLPDYKENINKEEATFTETTEKTFTKIDGSKVTVIKKTTYVEYSKEKNTIGAWGCLVSSLAIVLSYMKGEDITPQDVDKVADDAGAYNVSSVLDYRKMINDIYHLSAKSENVSQSSNETILSKIDAFLTGENKKPVILMYGTQGNSHFVVVIGLHYDDYGNISHYIISDPNSNTDKARYLDRETLLCPYNKSRKVTHIISLGESN
jgi:hypothetical protein